jgi:hypothetical protein
VAEELIASIFRLKVYVEHGRSCVDIGRPMGVGRMLKDSWSLILHQFVIGDLNLLIL